MTQEYTKSELQVIYGTKYGTNMQENVHFFQELHQVGLAHAHPNYLTLMFLWACSIALQESQKFSKN